MKIELYINRELCNIGDPNKFSVYLKKQLYNPAELSLKDAQASYSITLPADELNSRIFGFVNVEEVQGKFEKLYDAELIVNGIRVFEGKFKMSEITSYSYKGNLGIPAYKTVKEIFGDKNMNELGEWILDLTKYGDGLDFISAINKEKNPDCIFPLVLYGLMPRNADVTPMYEDAKDQSDKFKIAYQKDYKAIYDENVRFGIEDIPASVNCMNMLKKIFLNQKYTLSGTAFDDARLQNLYVSYRNPTDYAQGWNWGDLAEVKISGKWKTITRIVENSILFYDEPERRIETNSNDYGEYYNINLFDCNNIEFTEIKDSGTNVMYNEYDDTFIDQDTNPYKRKSLHLVIPKSGYYKVRLDCNILELNDYKSIEGLLFTDPVTDLKFTQADQDNKRFAEFHRLRFEIQLMRDYGTGDFKNVNVVGMFNKPQFPQTNFGDSSQGTKYYPYQKGPMVVDPCVNENFICGLHWGSRYFGKKDWNGKDYEERGKTASDRLVNSSPNYMFIANGFSWDKTFSQRTKILSAYDSSVYIDGERQESNYYKWGIVDVYDVDKDGNRIDYDKKKDDETVSELRDETAGDEEEEVVAEKTVFIGEWDNRIIKQRYGVFKDYPKPDEVPNKYEQTNYVENVAINGKNEYEAGRGYVESIIWLERGERLAVCLAGDLADLNGSKKLWSECVVMMDNVEFSLHVEPFRTDIEWNNFDSKGNCDEQKLLSWNTEQIEDPETGKMVDRKDKGFRKGEINLIDFLPSNMTADSWIEQFCKAFNLSLVRVDETHFELNLNNSNISSDTTRLIDIDQRAHIVHRTNQSLGLPKEYKLGFTLDDEQEGYVASQVLDKDGYLISAESGEGTLFTGSVETTVTELKSNFSYCWYKQLYKVEKEENEPKYEEQHIKKYVEVPVISKHEVWQQTGSGDYKEMVKKLYMDSPQRFWYKKDTERFPMGMQWITEDTTPAETSVEESATTDATDTSTTQKTLPQKYVDVAIVQNEYGGDNGLKLMYEDKPNSITREYFFVPDVGLAYTEIECVLTPDEYNRLNVSLARFNGSLYHVISVDGYDPTCRKPAKLKLIPKMR